MVLKEHCEQVGTCRLHDLMADFMRPQQITETGSAYITRVINRRQELCQAGTNIPVEQVKAALMEGLKREYQPYLSDIHSTTTNIDELRTKLVGTCNRVERLMKREAAESHTSAHDSSRRTGLPATTSQLHWQTACTIPSSSAAERDRGPTRLPVNRCKYH